MKVKKKFTLVSLSQEELSHLQRQTVPVMHILPKLQSDTDSRLVANS